MTAAPARIDDAVELPQLTKAQARQFVKRIHRAAEEVHNSATRWHVLLVEAHRLAIHVTLGYKSWEQFAVNELGMSSANAYRALERGKVAAQLEKQGIKEPASLISDRQAAVLSHDLPAAADEIVSDVKSGKSAQQAVKSAVQKRAKPIDPPPAASKSESADSEVLHALIDELTRLSVAAAAQVFSESEIAKLVKWGHAVYDKLTAKQAAKKSASPIKKTAAKRSTATAKTTAAKKSSTRRSVNPSDCAHPVSRRLGDKCGACGETVKSR